ncbi:hypothetical protein MXB_5263 [Myxobolus squamalis]|nr:hypothetical protein MXB_5263 [Myxobolus squamalis]
MAEFQIGNMYFDPSNIRMSNYTHPVNTQHVYKNGARKYISLTDTFNKKDGNEKLREVNNTNKIVAFQNNGTITNNGRFNFYSLGPTENSEIISYFSPQNGYPMIQYQSQLDICPGQNLQPFNYNQPPDGGNIHKLAFPNIPNISTHSYIPSITNENSLSFPTYFNGNQYFENKFIQGENIKYQDNITGSTILFDPFALNYIRKTTIYNLDQPEKEQGINELLDIRNIPFNQTNTSDFNTNILLTLENEFLWKQFYDLDNEMIITKHGRRIYPYLVISVLGLHPFKKYKISAGFHQVSPHRFKYQKNKGWKLGTTNDLVQRTIQNYPHPEGVQPGEFWMSKSINFLRLKIFLNSMHLYIIIITIIEVDEHNGEYVVLKKNLDYTKFIAVTAYQNKKIDYKIKNNTQSLCKRFQKWSAET